MARLPFSLFKQGIKEYEVCDAEARSDIGVLNSDLSVISSQIVLEAGKFNSVDINTVRKQGHIVYVDFRGDLKAASGRPLLIGHLPNGFYPSEVVYQSVQLGGAFGDLVYIGIDGNIYLSYINGINGFINFSLSFIQS